MSEVGHEVCRLSSVFSPVGYRGTPPYGVQVILNIFLCIAARYFYLNKRAHNNI